MKIQSERLRAIVTRHINQIRAISPLSLNQGEVQQSVNTWVRNSEQNNIQNPLQVSPIRNVVSPIRNIQIRQRNMSSPRELGKRIIRPTKRLVVENTKSKYYREEPIQFGINYIAQSDNSKRNQQMSQRTGAMRREMFGNR